MRLKGKKTMFIHFYQPLITILYRKVPISNRISDESALIRNFLRNGRVRVNIICDLEENKKVLYDIGNS